MSRTTAYRAAVPVERPPARFVTPDDAAELLGVTPRTIRNFIATGQLTGYRLGKRMLRVDLTEVENLPRAIPTAGRPA